LLQEKDRYDQMEQQNIEQMGIDRREDLILSFEQLPYFVRLMPHELSTNKNYKNI